MTAGRAVREVTEEAGLREVYDVLLAPSFPPAELVPPDVLLDGVAGGALSVRTARDGSGPVAVAVTQRLDPAPAVLLLYFATRRDARGQGVGSELFGELTRAVLERDRPQLFLAEVERPDRHRGSVEHGDPTARLRFYGRHGARALDVPYLQAPIGDEDPVLGMLLLALHVDPSVLSGRDGLESVPGAALLGPAVDAMLDGYGLEDAGSAAARLRAAASAETVRLLPVEDYALIASS